jgi:molecular chaperone DnaK
MEGSDVEDIKAKTNALAQVAMKLGEALYKQQGGGAAGPEAGAAGGASSGGAKTDDEVVDADFTEVKDDDKHS